MKVLRLGMIAPVLLLFLLQCGKESQAPGRAEASKDQSASAMGGARAVDDRVTKSRARIAFKKSKEQDTKTLEQKPKPNTKLGGKRPSLKPGYVKPAALGPRLLKEYHIRLSYRTKDFAGSRDKLLELVGRYGNLDRSSSSATGRPYMNARFYISADKLTEALLEMKKLGRLESETIGGPDHTERFMLNARKRNREALRAARKRNIARSGLVAKNWAQRMRSLEASEDRLDAADHAIAVIYRRVARARFDLTLRGPRTAPAVEFPPYYKAVVGLTNLLLELTYLLVWLSPLLLLLLLGWFFKARLLQLIRRLRGTPQQA